MINKPASKPSKHYVNNKQMLDSISEYREKVHAAIAAETEKPLVPNYIGECILLIANNLAKKPNFVNYTYKEEMISDGIENCLQYIDNFDPAKSTNPFAYFTQIIYYAFIRRIHKEKKQSYIKHKSLEHSIIFNTLVGGNDEGHFESKNNQQDNDRINSLINSVERKFVKPKKKKGIENFLDEEPPTKVEEE